MLRPIRAIASAASALVVAYIGVCAAQSNGGSPLIPDYTAEESEYMPRLAALARTDEGEALKECDSLLIKTPTAQACRLLRSDLLIKRGDATNARNDLLVVIEGGGAYKLGALSRLAMLYGSTGDRKAEATANREVAAYYESAGSEKVRAAWLIQAACQNRALALEAEGKAGEALKLLQENLNGAQDDRDKALATIAYVRLALRQGDYRNANAFGESFPDNLKARLQKSEALNFRVLMAEASWAAGKREDAYKMSLALLRDALDSTERSGDSVAMAAAMIRTLGLLPEGGPERKLVMDLLAMAQRRLSICGPYSLEEVIGAMLGGKDLKDVKSRVKSALKGAPRLEWALWASTFIGLAEGEKGKELLKLVPAGTVQSQIIKVTLAAQASRPATTQPEGK